MAFPIYMFSGTKTATVGATTPAAPATPWAVDDILLFTVQYDEAPGVSLSSAQGFAEVTNSPQGSVGDSLSVFWKRATSTADTMPTVADPGDHAATQMHVFRGCETSGNPWNVTGGGTAGNSTSWATNGVTTTVADCLIVEIVAGGFDTATAQSSGQANGSLAAVTEIVDSWMSIGLGGGFVLVTGQKASPGATGSTTGTLANSSQKAFLTIAFMEPQVVAVNLPKPLIVNTAPDRAATY